MRVAEELRAAAEAAKAAGDAEAARKAEEVAKAAEEAAAKEIQEALEAQEAHRVRGPVVKTLVGIFTRKGTLPSNWMTAAPFLAAHATPARPLAPHVLAAPPATPACFARSCNIIVLVS